MGKSGAKYREAYKNKRRNDNRWLTETPNMDELYYMNAKDSRKSLSEFKVTIYYETEDEVGKIESNIKSYGGEVDNLFESYDFKKQGTKIQVFFNESKRCMELALNAKGVRFSQWIGGVTINSPELK